MSTWKPFVIFSPTFVRSKLCQQYKLEELAHHKKLKRVSEGARWGWGRVIKGKCFQTLSNLRYLENIIRSCKTLVWVVEYVWDWRALTHTPQPLNFQICELKFWFHLFVVSVIGGYLSSWCFLFCNLIFFGDERVCSYIIYASWSNSFSSVYISHNMSQSHQENSFWQQCERFWNPNPFSRSKSFPFRPRRINRKHFLDEFESVVVENLIFWYIFILLNSNLCYNFTPFSCVSVK